MFVKLFPDAPSTSLFVFQGNINRNIGNQDVGTLSGEVLSPTNGRWVFEDKDVVLKIGDVINYYVFVSVNRAGYLKDNLSYTVQGKLLYIFFSNRLSYFNK